MGDAALRGGSSMEVGLAANPQEAHQAGRHMIRPREGLLAPHEQDGRAGSAGRHARYSSRRFSLENADRSRVNACSDRVVSTS